MIIIPLIIIIIAIIPLCLYRLLTHRSRRVWTGGSDRQRTYVIASEAVPAALARSYLQGWREIPAAEIPRLKYVDLVISMGSTGRFSIDRIRARLKSRLNATDITDKAKLHHHLAGTPLIAKTFVVDEASKIPADTVWMVRANYGWKGSANRVATTTAELQEIRQEFMSAKPGATVIASEYIDPLLYKDHKFHLRAHVIVSVCETGRFATIPLGMEILTAKEPFVFGDWANRAIHDSHFSEDLYGLANDHLPELIEPTVGVLGDAMQRLIGYPSVYPESPAAYDVIGADVMFRKDGTPIIIELNKLPGFDFGRFTTERDRIVGELVSHIMDGPVRAAFDHAPPSDQLRIVARSRSYIYIGDQLPEASVAARLPGWQRADIDTGSADLVIASGRGLDDKRLYKAQAFLKCHLDCPDITNKRKLYMHLAEYAPDLIPRSFIVDDSSTVAPGETWIVRAAWGFGGRAVEIATTTEELQKIRQAFAKQKTDDTIASEYITRPMLYQGRKFHLRIYALLYVAADGSRTFSMLKRGLLIPAMREYKSDDWNDRDIHDTHGKGNPLLGLFPDAYIAEFGADPTDRIADALRRAVEPLMPLAKPYSESNAGFEMMGADIMFWDDGRLQIIEINDNPGLTWLAAHPAGAETGEMVLDFQFAEAIAPAFGLEAPSVDALRLASAGPNAQK